MRERRAILAVVLGALLVAFPGAALAQGGAAATAELEDADGNPVGEATFTEGPDGVTINVTVEQGVEPGEHGIHVHEIGDISPDFEAAGEHLNAESAEHGFDNSSGPHAGDLENITVTEDETATYTTTTDRVTLDSGENGLLDSDGSTLIIHQSATTTRPTPPARPATGSRPA